MNTLRHFRKEKDEFFADHPQSPLTHEQKHSFEGLNYFPENPGLKLTVRVEEFAEKEQITMQTSTGGYIDLPKIWPFPIQYRRAASRTHDLFK